MNNNLNNFLISKKGKIIHQIWFSGIQSKNKADISYKKLQKFRDSWTINNPEWFHIIWNNKMANDFIKLYFPRYLKLYRNFTYEIQRCDILRYFLLYKYGGIYADMDYYCNKSFDSILETYKNDIYLVQTPNNFMYNTYVSNSLMYSVPSHKFWLKLINNIKNNDISHYYTKHIIIMYSTGPAMLTNTFNEYKYRYNVKYFPYELFNPYGIADIKIINKNIYTYHLGKGEWENDDSKFMIFLYTNYTIISLIIIFSIISLIFSLK